jgi:(p)ppGpp synthase/HD superfamily hydrolase
MGIYSKNELLQVEKAIIFLINETNRFCRNKKPFVLHGIRVGVKCMEYQRPVSTVIAGLLHDLIEDTKCTEFQITKRFGRKAGILVRALTMDYSFTDYQLRWHDAAERLKISGDEVILIKALDIIDNMPYYSQQVTRKMDRQKLMWKWDFFKRAFSVELKRLKLFSTYTKQLRTVKR